MKLKQSRTNSQPGEALKDEDNRSKQTKPTKTGLQIEKQAGRWSGNPGWWGGGPGWDFGTDLALSSFWHQS